MAAAGKGRGFRAVWREGGPYRRAVHVLLVANVVVAVALVVRLSLLDDEEPVGTRAGGGAAVAPSQEASPSDVPPSGEPEAQLPFARPPVPGPASSTVDSASAVPADPGPAFLTPPEEFVPVDDAQASTGPLDLEAVVQLDGSDPAAAREMFTALGFTGARSRAWQSPTDSLLVVAYQFADERGAATYVGEAAALRRADPAAAALPLTGIPGASAYRLQVPGDPTQVALLARGTTAYVVGLVGPAAGDPAAATLHRLALLQYEAAL